MPGRLETERRAIESRLPVRVRWHLDGTPWDWDFSRARHPLQAVQASDVGTGAIEEEWLSIYLFGDEDYAEGGGASPFVGVHISTGAVHSLDIEREGPALYLFNSSVLRFIETFLLFDRVLRGQSDTPSGLEERVRAIDPEAFAQSEWNELAQYVEALSSGA